MFNTVYDKLFFAGFIPICIVFVGVENRLLYDGAFPTPFLLIYASIVFAGTFSGMIGGLVAGLIGIGLLLHAYILGFGPYSLTGQAWTAALGAALFLGTGLMLGWLHSRIRALEAQGRERRDALQVQLAAESAAKDRSESTLSQREARLQTAVRIAGIGHFSFISSNGICDFCSDVHAAHFGLTPEEFIDRTSGPIPELFYVHPDDHHIIEDAIHRIKFGEVMSFEYRGLHANGEIRHIHEIVEPRFNEVGVVVREIGTSRDLTELRQAEQRLRVSQKLEAVGHLTAGVAHDFNNLLAIILGNLELLPYATSDADTARMIDDALAACKRGAKLTGQLLSFGRRAMLRPETVDVGSVITQLQSLLRRTIPTTIDIRIEDCDANCYCHIDESQFEAAILNLMINGADAMPEGGTLRLSVTSRELDAAEIGSRGLSLVRGRYVEIAVSDTGGGMSEDVQSRAFDPFFTTKDIGKGSGLGLSMVQGFVRQTGGDVAMVSREGVGTTISLFFQQVPPPMASAQEKLSEPTRTDRADIILIVEDEPAVRATIEAQIRSLGYLTLTAEDAETALQLVDGRCDIDLVLSDVAMPGEMDGIGLARAIRERQPDLPVVLLTGYQSDGDGPETSDIDSCPVLVKPVTRRELSLGLCSALGHAENIPGGPEDVLPG